MIPDARGRRFTVPMLARDTTESHRVSTPLELLFDLTFVVAVGQVARELAHSVSANEAGGAVGRYLLVFFAIWWAWMNFSWFASAFDTDDAPYRLLTLLQMAGVLVLAAGVSSAFEKADFTAVTAGYVIMRSAMILQWLRAAHSDRAARRSALRYAGAIFVIQVGWVLRLLLPARLGTAAFFVLAAAELAGPLWAERAGTTSWHPHHIAERYGLFTLIVLGESVTAAANAVQASVVRGGWDTGVVLVFAGGLGLLFALWWIYYLKEAGEGLARRPGMAYWWGYGHYGIFAALAALGAGLEVAAGALNGRLQASDTLVAFAVAVPVCVFLLLVWALHAPLSAGTSFHDLPRVLAAITATLVIAGLTALGPPLSVVMLGLALPSSAIVLNAVLTGRSPADTKDEDREDAETGTANTGPGAADPLSAIDFDQRS